MMNTVQRLNTIVQTNNLTMQSMNGSDLTTTQVLIVFGISLVVGAALMGLVSWLLNR